MRNKGHHHAGERFYIYTNSYTFSLFHFKHIAIAFCTRQSGCCHRLSRDARWHHSVTCLPYLVPSTTDMSNQSSHHCLGGPQVAALFDSRRSKLQAAARNDTSMKPSSNALQIYFVILSSFSHYSTTSWCQSRLHISVLQTGHVRAPGAV